MQITSHPTAPSFRDAAFPFLLQHEAENGLIITLSLRASDTPTVLLTVHDAGILVAAAAMQAGKPLVLTRAPANALIALAHHLADQNATLTDIDGPIQSCETFADAFIARTGRKRAETLPQRIYQLTQVIPPAPVPGAMHQAVESEIDFLHAWAIAFNNDIGYSHEPPPPRTFIETRVRAGGLYLWKLPTGQPVAMANQARPTPTGIAVNLVYTPPELRRQGYASNLVAGLCQHLLASGRHFVCLYTDSANPTSNHIYAALGFEPIAQVAHCKLSPPIVIPPTAP